MFVFSLLLPTLPHTLLASHGLVPAGTALVQSGHRPAGHRLIVSHGTGAFRAWLFYFASTNVGAFGLPTPPLLDSSEFTPTRLLKPQKKGSQLNSGHESKSDMGQGTFNTFYISSVLMCLYSLC